MLGGIGHRDREGAAVALEGEHEVLRRHLTGDEARDAGIDFEVREVDGGHAILSREGPRQVGLFYEPERDEVVAQAYAVLALFLQRQIQLFTRNEPFTNENVHRIVRKRRQVLSIF